MKIVNLILTSQNGGAEQVAIDYCHVLKNYLNHEVLAIVKDDAPYAHKFEELGVKVKKIKNNLGYFDFFAINSIKNILKEFDADILISHAGRSMVLGRKAIKKIKNKKIFEIAVNHSMNVKRSVDADMIISVNKQIFYRTIDLGKTAEKSFILPNAIDMSDAIIDAPKVNLQNKKTIILGVIGRLDKRKGFRYVISALKLLEGFSDKNFILKIAGSGPREQFLKQSTAKLKLEDKVQFLGWTNDKKKFFNEIDIFIMPSQRETFGLVLLEAMKFRKPIIACDADGPKKIIRNEIDGFLISLEPLVDTEIRLAGAVKRVLQEPDLVNKMIENSFARLKEKFSFEAMAMNLKEIVGKVG